MPTTERPIAALSLRLAPIALMLMLLAAPVIAFAQNPNNPAAPPQPSALRQSPAVWLGMLVMIVLTGVIISVSLMPSKRSHQE
jgi:hypothetical protein